MTPTEEIAERYRQRGARFDADAERLGARSRLIGNLRGLTFGVTAVALGFSIFGDGGLLALSAAGLSFAAFFGLVTYHSRVIEQEAHARRWARVNDCGRLRTTDGWRTLPTTGAGLIPGDHPYAGDLDVYGPGSLFQRVSVAHTRYGQKTLARWLAEPAEAAEIKARQQAVRDLAPRLDFRQALEAESLAIVERAGKEPGTMEVGIGPNPEPLLRWAEAEPELTPRPWVRLLAWVLPTCTVAGMVASFGFGKPMVLWTAPFLAQVVLLASQRRTTTAAFAAASSTEGAFLRYGAMLRLVEELDAAAPWVNERKARLMRKDAEGESSGIASSGIVPSQSMRSFRSIVGWFDLRHNGMVYPFVNALLCWDLHCTLALERWKARGGKYARGWFEVLGDMESISSLAGLAHDEPDFCLPRVEAHEPALEGGGREGLFEAERLGHPLIADSKRVENDVDPLRGGEALLITGSNMSGKSTFLRSVGTACVMAFAGGPVCARELRVTLCEVITSIRIADSLAGGVSHFYAELEKLKRVVDATSGPRPVLFLLDEVLHGTNSRERQIGARWVTAQLLERGALGVVTTHDSELCRLTPELMERVRQAHFRENVQGDRMTFDYTLRPGPVTEGNALRLMRLVGLSVPLE